MGTGSKIRVFREIGLSRVLTGGDAEAYKDTDESVLPAGFELRGTQYPVSKEERK
jgi:hypothetical protein